MAAPAAVVVAAAPVPTPNETTSCRTSDTLGDATNILDWLRIGTSLTLTKKKKNIVPIGGFTKKPKFLLAEPGLIGLAIRSKGYDTLGVEFHIRNPKELDALCKLDKVVKNRLLSIKGVDSTYRPILEGNIVYCPAERVTVVDSKGRKLDIDQCKGMTYVGLTIQFNFVSFNEEQNTMQVSKECLFVQVDEEVEREPVPDRATEANTLEEIDYFVPNKRARKQAV